MKINLSRLCCFIKNVIILFIVIGFNAYQARSQGRPIMQLESSVFTHNSYIPIEYTGEGQDISPPLTWTNVPSGTRSLALVCDDPDAPMGTWDHWILYNIPPNLTHIEKGGNNLPAGVGLGKNSWGRLDYGGPMPPSGIHHYHFTLYALDTELDLQSGVKKDALLKAMEGHVLATATLTGLYQLQRPKQY